MIAHLARCLKLLPDNRYACTCGADAQNDLAARLDQATSARQKADAIDRRWGVDPEAERRLDAMLRETRPAAPPRVKLWTAGAPAEQAATRDIRRGFVPLADVPPDVLADIDRPPPPVRADTPLRAVARMLDRLHARATHHDSPRHLLATAYEHVELAASLSPAEAIRALDDVEPTANEPTHSEKPDAPERP